MCVCVCVCVCACVCVCVCVCEGIHSIMLKLRGSTFLPSYCTAEPSVWSSCGPCREPEHTDSQLLDSKHTKLPCPAPFSSFARRAFPSLHWVWRWRSESPTPAVNMQNQCVCACVHVCVSSDRCHKGKQVCTGTGPAPLPALAAGLNSGLGSGPTCLPFPVGMTPGPLPFGNSAFGTHTSCGKPGANT